MESKNISPITIILQRDANDRNKDDVIFIRPTDTNSFRVRYQDKFSNVTYEFTDSWEEVTAYLAQIFAVLPFDDEPYIGIQFTLPAYPSILLKISKLEEDYLMDKIWSMLESVVKGWPLTLRD